MCFSILVPESFIWTVGTAGLMVVFGRENMVMISTEVISNENNMKTTLLPH